MKRSLRNLLLVLSLAAAMRSTSFAEAPPPEVLPSEAIVGNSSALDAEEKRRIEVLATKPIDDVTVNVQPTAGALPDDIAAKIFDAEPTVNGNRERGFGGTVYFWEASNLAHRPLYFEQAYVERYGYNYRCLQPVVSGAEFYTDVALLPIKMAATIRRPYIYALGPQRPGNRGTNNPRW